MRPLPFLCLLTPLAALMIVLGIACGDDADEGDGGGEELTLEQYFSEVETLSAQFNQDRVELEGKYPDAFDSPEETRSLFQEVWPLLNTLADDLEAISPLHPPSGCVFHTRCPIAIDECKRVLPEWRNVGSGDKEHWVACIRV